MASQGSKDAHKDAIAMMILGHRGARAIAPDNTIAAYRAALDAGASGTELDVRWAADGTPVCVHDATINPGDGPVRVCETSREILIRCGVITLSDALEVLRGARVLVEIKNSPWETCHDATGGFARSVASMVPPGTIVGSFDPITLADVRTVRSDLRTAIITAAAIDPISNLDAAIDGGHDICSVEHHAITPSFVATAHAAGRQVYAWATDEPDRVRELAVMGVDALICDDPARAIEALRAG